MGDDGIGTGPGLDGQGATGRNGGNLAGQADFDEMAEFGAFEQAQNTERNEAANGFADRSTRDTNGAGEPLNGEAQARLSFKAAVAQEMRIDTAIEDGETQTRGENVFHLLPDLMGIGAGSGGSVGRFVVHVVS